MNELFLSKREKERIEAFEMWAWKRIGRIRWVDGISNKEVLKRSKEGRTLRNTQKEKE